jgi:hypothetical protein
MSSGRGFLFFKMQKNLRGFLQGGSNDCHVEPSSGCGEGSLAPADKPSPTTIRNEKKQQRDRCD